MWSALLAQAWSDSSHAIAPTTKPASTVWEIVQSSGPSNETPATLHWSQATSSSSSTTTPTTIATTYNCMTTKVHRQPSMGDAVERYNMIQETQYLDHLSTALHLSERCHTTTNYLNIGNDCCVCSRYCTTSRRR